MESEVDIETENSNEVEKRAAMVGCRMDWPLCSKRGLVLGAYVIWWETRSPCSWVVFHWPASLPRFFMG